ncbi:unnamed protein product [Penicillium olsonii]|nr:unnamed protein product [Penicillium olsonii]
MDSSGPQDVPRFASFRPLTAPPSAANPSDHDDARRSGRSSSRASRRSHRSRQESKRRSREASQARHAAEQAGSRNAVAPEPTVATEVNADFLLDAQGDRDIARYGPSQYELPSYNRAGQGFVVGAPGKRITRESRHENALVFDDAAGLASTKPLSAANLAALDSASPDIIQKAASTRSLSQFPDTDHLRDFIPTEGMLPWAEELTATFMDDIRSPEKSDFPKAEGTVKESREASSDSTPTETAILFRNNELSEQVHLDPGNITAWLQLAEHQELLLVGARSGGAPLSKSEAQALAEARLSIYEKGIDSNPASPQLDRLLLGRMEQGARLWDNWKVISEWEDTLTLYPNFISVWMGYLDHFQRGSDNSIFEKCFGRFKYCLELISCYGSGLYKNQIRSYLFLRLTLFLRESGYTEQAVGLWQAVLDFTCFRPSQIGTGYDAVLAFGEYWTSQTARIGEPGWIGWNQGGKSSLHDDEDISSPQTHADVSETFKTWALSERGQMAKTRLPSGTFDATQKDSADQVVLDDDCKEILPYFLDYTLSFEPLINAFMHFCHLPSLAMPQNIRDARLWSGDSFLRNEYMNDPKSTIADWIKFQHSGESTTTVKPFAFPHHNFLQSTHTLFADPNTWFSSLPKWVETTSHTSSVLEPQFVQRVLFVLTDKYEDTWLGEYALALAFACSNRQGKKYAKHVLSKRSSDMRFYNAAALMNWRTGDRPFAVKVWTIALALFQEPEDKYLRGSATLWNSWIWELLSEGRNGQASYLLQAIPSKTIDLTSYSAADGTELDSITFLRVQKYLVAAQQHAIAHNDPQAYSSHTDCLAIALYLTDHSLQLVLKVYDDAVRSLNGLDENVTTFATELLFQARARLVYLWVDTKKGQFKPSEIRQVFLESLRYFPHNTIFLSLLKWNDARVNPMDRTRDILSVTTGTGTQTPDHLGLKHRIPITTHLFNIYVEMGRPVVLGTTAHSVRAAFERAIDDSSITIGNTRAHKDIHEVGSSASGQSNLTLWRLYLTFELYGQRNVARAREVFFRAVGFCPWLKELYMFAFEHLRADLTAMLPPCWDNTEGEANSAGFSSADLRALYAKMQQSGFRIHREVDSFWED